MDSSTNIVKADRSIRLAFWLLAMLAGAWLVAMIGEKLESRLAPVVTDFDVIYSDPQEEYVIIDGTMRKLRDCQFLHLVGYVGDIDDEKWERERLHIRFHDGPSATTGGGTRDPGLQRWGPWKVTRPNNIAGPHMWIRVTHRCHWFYNTSGVYYITDASKIFP